MIDERIKAINQYNGFNLATGIKVSDWQDGLGIVTLTPAPEHTNPAGVIHGGAMMGMLDVALALPGSYEDPPLALMPGLTLSLTTQFLAVATIEGGLLTARATKTGGGKNVFFSEGQITDSTGRLIATATGVFKRGRQPAS